MPGTDEARASAETLAAYDIATTIAADLTALHPNWVVNATGPCVVVIEPGETTVGRARNVGDVHVIEIHTIKQSAA